MPNEHLSLDAMRGAALAAGADPIVVDCLHAMLKDTALSSTFTEDDLAERVHAYKYLEALSQDKLLRKRSATPVPEVKTSSVTGTTGSPIAW